MLWHFSDLDEGRSRALDNLGRVYARMKQFEKAIQVLVSPLLSIFSKITNTVNEILRIIYFRRSEKFEFSIVCKIKNTTTIANPSHLPLTPNPAAGRRNCRRVTPPWSELGCCTKSAVATLKSEPTPAPNSTASRVWTAQLASKTSSGSWTPACWSPRH